MTNFYFSSRKNNLFSKINFKFFIFLTNLVPIYILTYSCNFLAAKSKTETYTLNVEKLKCLDSSPEITNLPSKISFNYMSAYTQNIIDLKFYATKSVDSPVLLEILIPTNSIVDMVLIIGPSLKSFSSLTKIINKFNQSIDWAKINNSFEIYFEENFVEIIFNGIIKQRTTLTVDDVYLLKSIKYFGFVAMENIALTMNGILYTNLFPLNIFKDNCLNCPAENSLILGIMNINYHTLKDQPTIKCPDSMFKNGLKCLYVCEAQNILKIYDNNIAECVPSCKKGFYYKDNSCLNNCFDNCQECTSSTTCTKCIETRTLLTQNNMNYCFIKIENCLTYDFTTGFCKICEDTFYLNIIYKTCSKCPDTCLQCENTENCSKCKSGYDLKNKKCGYYCFNNCDVCNVNKQCEKCNENYSPKKTKESDKIIDCILSPFCLKFNEQEKCTECKTGFYLNSINFDCIPCTVFDSKCTLCNELLSCYQCLNTNNDKYLLKEGKCLCEASTCKKCEEGCKVCDDGKCLDKPCEINCENCNSDGTCNICKGGFYKTNNKACKAIVLCSKSSDGLCVECKNNFKYDSVKEECICEGVKDGDFCCEKNIVGCVEKNIKYFQKTNLDFCVCEKCEENFLEFNYSCYEKSKFKDEDCMYFDKRLSLPFEIPEKECLKNEKIFDLDLKYSCRSFNFTVNNSEIIKKLDGKKKYFIFSYTNNQNYNYTGYGRVQNYINNLNCSDAIESFLYFSLNCLFPFEIGFEKIISFKNIKNENLFDGKNNITNNLFVDLITDYVDFCNIPISILNENSILIDYALQAKNILIDYKNRKIMNTTNCINLLDPGISNNKNNTKCFNCEQIGYFFAESADDCYISIIRDKNFKETFKILFYVFLAINLIIIFILIIIWFFKKDFLEDFVNNNINIENGNENKIINIKEEKILSKKFEKKDYIDLIISLVNLTNFIMDFGYVLFLTTINIKSYYTVIIIFCMYPLFYIFVGTFLFLKNLKKIKLKIHTRILLFLPFVFIFVLGCISNLIANKIEIIKINFILEYAGYDFEKMDDFQRIKLKYKLKISDIVFKMIPFLITEICMNNLNNGWNQIFSVISFIVLLVNILCAFTYILSETLNIRKIKKGKEIFENLSKKKENEIENNIIENQILIPHQENESQNNLEGKQKNKPKTIYNPYNNKENEINKILNKEENIISEIKNYENYVVKNKKESLEFKRNQSAENISIRDIKLSKLNNIDVNDFISQIN